MLMKLGEVIKRFREENGISQREFARRCELSNSLISILEIGINPQTGKEMEPDLRTYRRLASGMGISLQQLQKLLQDDATIALDQSQLTEEDMEFLEALHQDHELRMLFDHTRKMPHDDVVLIRQFAERLKKSDD